MIRKSITGIVLALAATAAYSQTKPTEATTKVKKVLHYTKIGGWVHVDGQKDLTAVLNKLSAAKGFQVTHTGNEGSLTLENLKQYNAIIWDNNVNGGASVPGTSQRQAVLDYVKQGGGWLLVHGAGDHQDSWVDLRNLLATRFSTHGDQGSGKVRIDKEAKSHKELKFLVQDLPDTASLTKDEWYAFQRSVRGVQGVTVVATSGNGPSNVMLPYADGTKPEDAAYIWAREMPDYKGRILYTAVGHGGNQLYAQADSFATKMTWENLRYVSGDYQYGCTDKNASNYNADARVNDGSCASVSLQGRSGQAGMGFSLSHAGRKTAIEFPHSGRAYTVELRDYRGALVWSGRFEGANEVSLDGAHLQKGIYQMVARSGKNIVRHRLPLL